MPNTFLSSKTIIAQALGLLEREIVLPRLVQTFGATDFRGTQGDTLTMRVPARLTARDAEFGDRTAPITVDDLTETSVDVSLNVHPYSAVAVSDEQLTLNISDFATQVLQPQVSAVGMRLEEIIADTLEAAPVAITIPMVGGVDDPYDIAVEARKYLNRANVPMADRALVLGSDVEAAFLKSDKLSKVNESGSDSALRDAVVGRVAGFLVVTSNAIDPEHAFALHRSAIAFANVAPAVPDGASFGAAQTYQGLALRWIRDYDPAYLRDRSVVSSLAGAASVNDGMGGATPTNENVRAVAITYTP